MASDPDTYTHHPLLFDPKDKTLSLSHASPSLSKHLNELNTLSKSLSSLPIPIPPPPLPVSPHRSAAIDKLRTSGNNEFRKQQYSSAINYYTMAIQAAQTRPVWEPAGLMRDEMQVLYANRAQAYLGMGCWPEAYADADMAVDMKKIQNPKAWWRKGKALMEMGRVDEAREVLKDGLEFGEDQELRALLKEVEGKIDGRKGKV
ncbi:hypothetical protein EX30DRAFT_103940 [Ascodesmis nigricans]|uniref:Uncharacterized protein n=1 Tax=Ascodesmis nigricans TaxID=341454 RepID=A0A4V3SJK7_9PEZI|nr:hypothetical protein EX30DRAFT_103940 [Ascodesmis nigricans]